MRKAALDAVGSLVASTERVVFVGSDLGAGTLDDVRRTHPDRILMEGIAEQHLVGFSAGLAIEGFVPYAHTIATFLTRRALEQIAIDVALHDLPVRLLASGGGMVYAPLGPTHQAIEDFALMRSIPNMTVFAPADPLEARLIVEFLADAPHPAYIRLGKGGEPVVTEALGAFRFGEARLMASGHDLVLITTGALLHEVLEAAALLDEQGVTTSVLHMPTIMPLDETAVIDAVRAHKASLVVEEHVPIGGLWSACAEAMVRTSHPLPIGRLGLPAGFAQNYGSQREHWTACGLTASGITAHILNQLEETHG